jgi:Cdc6-like AAA superfamily ATPase
MNQIQPNPFVPKSGMEPRMFVGREEQIELFDSVLESAVHNKRYDHCLIMGEWGIGKTALLKEFKKIAQSQKLLTSLVTIREFQESDTFLSATQHLIT